MKNNERTTKLRTITISPRGYGYIEDRLPTDARTGRAGSRLIRVELPAEMADEMVGHLEWWADALRWETEAEPRADRAALLRDITRNR